MRIDFSVIPRTRTIVVDISHAVKAIEREYGELLKPAKAGYASVGSFVPEFYCDDDYHVNGLASDGTMVAITATGRDIMENKNFPVDAGTVFSASTGKVVMTRRVFARRHKHYELVGDVRALIAELIKDKFLAFLYCNSDARELCALFANDYEERFFSNDIFVVEGERLRAYQVYRQETDSGFGLTIEKLLAREFGILKDFVGDDLNHIYSVRGDGQDLIVEKYIDYRIYDWKMQRGLYDSLQSR